MPNVVRHTTSGTVAWAGDDVVDPADCDGDDLDDGAAAGADTLELDPDEHADIDTTNADNTAKVTSHERLRPMPALSA